MITMIRPSENARVTNLDDITSIRYSYGNQNGYVINKGQQLSHTINGQNFIINSGRVVLQGVESDIDDNGVSIFIDSVSQTRYYVVYYNVNMATNNVSIESTFSTSGYPSVEFGDDFNQVSNGISRLPLYRFTATSGIISNVAKVVEPIKYINPDSIVELPDGTMTKFTLDSNNVLKLGNQIIPTQKLEWEGDLAFDANSEKTYDMGVKLDIKNQDKFFIECQESYAPVFLKSTIGIIYGSLECIFHVFGNMNQAILSVKFDNSGSTTVITLKKYSTAEQIMLPKLKKLYRVYE